MAEDPDGRGLFELDPPRAEGVEDYTARVAGPSHDVHLDEVVEQRRGVVERAAVEDIDWAAALVGGLAERQQRAVATGDHATAGQLAVQRARAQRELDAAKERGRDVLRGFSGWSGDRSTDRLIAHAREVLAASAVEVSRADRELARHDAVRRWAVDDEVAMADADGVLDGWQWDSDTRGDGPELGLHGGAHHRCYDDRDDGYSDGFGDQDDDGAGHERGAG